MRLPHLRSSLGLCALLLALLMGWMVARPAQAQPAPRNPSAVLFQATLAPVETATPLPTLAPEPSGGTPGNAVLVGLMLVCVMGLMLIGGVFIAILIVRLRTRLQK